MIFLASPLLALAMSGQISVATTTERGRGSYLLRTCKALDRVSALPAGQKAEGADLEQANYCWGYIEGFLDGLDMNKQPFCLHMFTEPQLAHEYVVYMEKHPAQLPNEAISTLIESLRSAHPCDKRQGGR